MRLILAASVGLAVVGAYAAYRVWEQGERDEQRPVDAIVVLGAAQYNGRPSPLFEARLDHALSLYFAGIAPRIVVTGGKAEGDRWTEADAARAYALAHDVPANAILAEDQGRNTLESLRAVADILADEELESAVFVSDRSHMLRVLRIARDLGIDAYGSPTRTSPLEHDIGARVQAYVHELGALAVYFVAGAAPPFESLETASSGR
ncbi:MAG TPA: YdcF family protein [Candidatus Limnocylindrales bacterium]|nr:YdcF family protein [Candidatus Limnocylindrales bacterium]